MGIRSDEHWLSVVDAFSAAAVGTAGWPEALLRLAAASGSHAGQLVSFGWNSAHLNWIGDPEPGWLEECNQHGGHDPAVNPRLAAGLNAPELTLITDEEIVSRQARRRSRFYADILPRTGRPFICATNLVKQPGITIGLAVLRTERQGEITGVQRTMFASIAPHVRAAVRIQTALENQGAQVLAGALEALSLSVFIHDRSGMVRAMTPAAEALISAGAPLGLRQGQLRTARPDETSALADAVRHATQGPVTPGEPALTTLLIRRDPDPPLILDVVRLPRQPHAFGFDPRALVVVRGAERNPARAQLLLQTAFRLTAAEAAVALQLADGQPPEAIGTARGVSLETVRTQIKAIYAKLEVHRQSELAARISHLR